MTRSSATDPAPGSVGAVFAALADPTRRTVLTLVARSGASTASGLAEVLPVSRQAISKHLELLHRAGLVSITTVGREVRFTAAPNSLRAAANWLIDTSVSWEERLTDLANRAEGST